MEVGRKKQINNNGKTLLFKKNTDYVNVNEFEF